MNIDFIIEKVKSSDSRAFKSLYEYYYPKVKGFLLAMRLDQELDDCLQDTFISIWKNRARLDSSRSLDSYLFTIAKNNSLKALKKQLMVELEEADSQLSSESSSPEHLVDTQIMEDTVKSTVEALPPQPKQVYYLSRIEGLSNSEIAQKLGISVKTVENYMNTALRRIRKELEFLSLLLLFFLS